MKVIVLQTDICWANPKTNVQRLEAMIDRHGDADLIVLPEMFSTGFCTLPEGVAEPADSETLHWMKRKAAERDCAIAGSLAIEENNRYYNRFYFVQPDGKVQWYDKKHLFTYGGEQMHYTPGTERVIVNFRGCASCCKFATTCVSPYGPGTGKTMMQPYTWPAGLRRAWKPGKPCFVHEPLKTSVS